MEHSTEWVNSFVIVEKDVSVDSGNSHAPCHQIKKKLWICLDPRDLNEALEHEPHYSRSVDELIGKFHGCKVFYIVDMKKGYWMVILHPDSRPLTCVLIDIGKIPMDMAFNGNNCCLRCLPEETRWNIPQCPRSHWNCRWYGHLQEINRGTW